MDDASATDTTSPQREATAAVDTEIYPMPGFATFQVADMARSTRWYVQGLGFVALAELPGPDGTKVLVHLRRHRYQDILLVTSPRPADQPRRPVGIGVRYGLSAGAEDRHARAATARAAGGGTVQGPSRTTWNSIDLLCTDPDGYEVVLTAPVSAGQADHNFSEVVVASVRA